jgi:hypothetical protein
VNATLKREFFHDFTYTHMKTLEDGENDTGYLLFPAKYFLSTLRQANEIAEMLITFDNDDDPEQIILTLLLENDAYIVNEIRLYDIVEPERAYAVVASNLHKMSEIRLNPSIMNKYLGHLTKEVDEFELIFMNDFFNVKSYEQEARDILHFNIKLCKSQFISYNLVEEGSSLVLKSSIFIRMINFATSLNDCELKMAFGEPHLPLILTLQYSHATVQAIQATIVPGEKRCKKRAPRKKVNEATHSTLKDVSISGYTEAMTSEKAGATSFAASSGQAGSSKHVESSGTSSKARFQFKETSMVQIADESFMPLQQQQRPETQINIDKSPQPPQSQKDKSMLVDNNNSFETIIGFDGLTNVTDEDSLQQQQQQRPETQINIDKSSQPPPQSQKNKSMLVDNNNSFETIIGFDGLTNVTNESASTLQSPISRKSSSLLSHTNDGESPPPRESQFKKRLHRQIGFTSTQQPSSHPVLSSGIIEQSGSNVCFGSDDENDPRQKKRPKSSKH